MEKRSNRWAFNLLFLCFGLAMYSLFSNIIGTWWLIAPPNYILFISSSLAFALGIIGFKDKSNWRAKTRSWVTVIFSALLSIALFLAILLTLFASLLGANERIETVQSPDGSYTIDFYRYDAGAAGTFGVRGEINGPLWFKKRFYHQQRVEQIEVEWLDNNTVLINNHKLNLKEGETYGY